MRIAAGALKDQCLCGVNVVTGMQMLLLVLYKSGV